MCASVCVRVCDRVSVGSFTSLRCVCVFVYVSFDVRTCRPVLACPQANLIGIKLFVGGMLDGMRVL